MCGITGWVSFDQDLTTEHPTLLAMTRTVAHRGPDAMATWSHRHVALGHCRLAVIDLLGGAQPMKYDTPAGPVVITYGGEVYDFRELRQELSSKGHRFRTASDTEVILHGYLEWGEEVAGRLNGMYAVAIWDGRKGSLLLFRDRLGVKPLYYWRLPDGVLFGSEPKAIFANPVTRPVVDVQGFRHLLAYALALPGVIWQGMAEVEPGGHVVVDQAGLRTGRYWRLKTEEHTDDLATTVSRTRSLLEDTVARQLIADVPTGVLLSGGLDSSTLASLAADVLEEDGRRVTTFSVDFVGHAADFVPDSERPAPDAPFVRQVAAQLDSAHTDIVLDHAAVANREARRAAVAAYDAPPGFGDRDRSMLLFFRTIRTRITVALSGESADELFGGYHWFHDPFLMGAQMFPWIAASIAAYGLPPGVMNAHVDARVRLSEHLSDAYLTACAEIEHLDGTSEGEREMRVSSYLHLTRMLRVLLDRKDRLSMASGLEVRVPYCDHRLVEYVYNTPWTMKSFDGREKSLLRAAIGPDLPETVTQRAKSAYPSVRDPRYLDLLCAEATSLLAEGNHPGFDLVDREWLVRALAVAPAGMSPQTRNTIEWILNFVAWIDLRRPTLNLS